MDQITRTYFSAPISHCHIRGQHRRTATGHPTIIPPPPTHKPLRSVKPQRPALGLPDNFAPAPYPATPAQTLLPLSPPVSLTRARTRLKWTTSGKIERQKIQGRYTKVVSGGTITSIPRSTIAEVEYQLITSTEASTLSTYTLAHGS